MSKKVKLQRGGNNVLVAIVIIIIIIVAITIFLMLEKEDIKGSLINIFKN